MNSIDIPNDEIKIVNNYFNICDGCVKFFS